jgi:hypothetical protein
MMMMMIIIIIILSAWSANEIRHFGSKPSVIAQIWEDLQTTLVVEARVLPEDLHMNLFLMAMHHLKRYPTELEREPIFDIDCTKGRDWVWFFVEKI